MKQRFFVIMFTGLLALISCKPKPAREAQPTNTRPGSFSPALSKNADSEYSTLPVIAKESPIISKARKRQVRFNHTDNWLLPLGIEGKNNVVVNTSNACITFGGATINGALKGYVSTVEKQTHWKNLRFPDPNRKNTPTGLKDGEFVISDTEFGHIYHFRGPGEGEISLPFKNTVQTPLSKGYYDMLVQAHTTGMKTIILPAASCGVFAQNKHFSFTNAAYSGMIEGIEKFLAEYPATTLTIILNNWDNKVVANVLQ